MTIGKCNPYLQNTKIETNAQSKKNSTENIDLKIESKVERIKREIESGTYKVDINKIAEAIASTI
jgi:anti-sigma28 factor (negative regulator of flagellin synthesis)